MGHHLANRHCDSSRCLLLRECTLHTETQRSLAGSSQLTQTLQIASLPTSPSSPYLGSAFQSQSGKAHKKCVVPVVDLLSSHHILIYIYIYYIHIQWSLVSRNLNSAWNSLIIEIKPWILNTSASKSAVNSNVQPQPQLDSTLSRLSSSYKDLT